MYTENIIKVLLLIGVIYLLSTCINCNEGFNNDIANIDLEKPINLFLDFNSDKYVIISFEDLKSEFRDRIKFALKNNIEYEKFRNPSPPAKPENLNDLENGTYIKMPLFIVKQSDVENLTNNKIVSFKLKKTDGQFRLMPIISNNTRVDQYVFNDEEVGLIYYSNKGKNQLKVNSEGFLINRELKEINFGDNIKLNVLSTELDSEKKIKVNISQ